MITKRKKNSLICMSCNKLILEGIDGTDYKIKFECPRCKQINTVKSVDAIIEDENVI